MIDILSRNWSRALGDVSASMVGTIGFISLIALALSGQEGSVDFSVAFSGYFEGGQIGLSILSVSGVAFIALLRHGPTNYALGVLLYVLLIGPIVATSIFIGMNPGFQPNGLSRTILAWLWWIFIGLHILWFLILLLQPSVPNAQQAGAGEENRVGRIKPGVRDRG